MKRVFIVRYQTGPGVGLAWPADPEQLEALAGLSPAAVYMRADPRHKTRFDVKRAPGAAGCRYALLAAPGRYHAPNETTNG